MSNIIDCRISLIKVGERYRKDFGDLEALSKSIDELGLLQPIGIDSNYRLVFGERRLRACQLLGKETIQARTVHISSLLKGELAENEFRKDFTPSERVAIGEAIEGELGNRVGINQYSDEGVENFPHPEGKTRDIAAKASGFGNGKTYEQAKQVVNEAAPELVQAMDEGKASVSAANTLLKLSKEEQAELAKTDKKTIQKKAKAVRQEDNQIATKHVQTIINLMDNLNRYLSYEGLTPREMTDRFLDEVNQDNKVLNNRINIAIPIMIEIGRLGEDLKAYQGGNNG